jgi:hypothetical protein
MESGREIVRVVICKTFTIPLFSVPAHDLMAVPKFRAFGASMRRFILVRLSFRHIGLSDLIYINPDALQINLDYFVKKSAGTSTEEAP